MESADKNSKTLVYIIDFYILNAVTTNELDIYVF